MKDKPVISIGIIFRNDIRCIERCLKALQPLRDAMACELVMADTGSVDGSREVAERYADILFDFPWINDFAAARNAVMDRCSGEWYFSVDTDEWLDPDISQLVDFFKAPQAKQYTNCGLMIRNYLKSIDGDYSDFLAIRFLRMSTGARFEGAIHERWPNEKCRRIFGLRNTMMYHDGYVGLNAEEGRAKRNRNMTLLRAELEKDPENLACLTQCIESSLGDMNHETFVCQGLEAVKKKLPLWDLLGPAIFRHAVISAQTYGLPELEERIKLCREWFPDSPYTLIDVTYVDFVTRIARKEYSGAVPQGEQYLRAVSDYRSGKYDTVEMLSNSFLSASEAREYMCRLLLADAYFHEKEYTKASDLLQTLECAKLTQQNVRDYLGVLMNLHAQSGLDMSLALAEFWSGIARPEPDENTKNARLSGFHSAAAVVFSAVYRMEEERQGFRHAYTIFLPLTGKCAAGIAAQILETQDVGEMTKALRTVDQWEDFPVAALAHALEWGVEFPLPEKPLTLEEMDGLAGILTRDGGIFTRLVQKLEDGPRIERWQKLAWNRGLVMAAVETVHWPAENPNVAAGMSVARAFAQVERQFLQRCYTPEALEPENLLVLPPMHRFGWYCAQAFQALDSGDAAGYVQQLREGLAACGGMKPMVEFLLDHTPQLHAPEPQDELKALAEQIRTVLSRFAPDDPAVAVLRQSEAYQKVAHLIEGTEPPIAGGQPQ